jgi:hypothetical protein
MIDEWLIKELEPVCDTKRIQEIADKIDEANNVSIVAPLVQELQDMNNALYQKQGELTRQSLDFQCYINGLRNTYDIPDPIEIIHTDNEKEFVQ